MSEKLYAINEEFYTFQGEGLNLGRAAYFIRLHGCPLHCPWCDSANTWHKDYVPTDIKREDSDALAARVKATDTALVVITGGEPCVHDLSELTAAIRRASQARIALETCGAFKISGEPDFITVSPKWSKHPLSQSIAAAHEVKIIVEHIGSFEQWEKRLSQIIKADDSLPCDTFAALMKQRGITVWLHPEWAQRDNAGVLDYITQTVKANPSLLRAGWQMHKNYKADSLDSGSRTPAPLGGELKNGF